MTTYRSAVVHTSIQAPPEKVVAFLSDMEKWKSWAPWIESATKYSPREWRLETDVGIMQFRFVEPNPLGVLDHDVTLATGVSVTNSLRAIPNGTGSELVMVLLQWPHMSAEEFERDVRAVTDDLQRIKDVIERG